MEEGVNKKKEAVQENNTIFGKEESPNEWVDNELKNYKFSEDFDDGLNLKKETYTLPADQERALFLKN